MQNRLLETMNKAQDLIRDPKNWIQGDFTDGKGCYCSLGALDVATNDDAGMYHTIRAYLGDAARSIDNRVLGAASFNDHHTHEEVMAMWDRAKEVASAAAA
jgi:hypothetical protein